MTTTRRSNLAATLRTTILLASLTGLLVVIGALIGGGQMALIFLGIALVINLGSYWFSDKIALGMSRAKEIQREDAPELFQTVEELCTRADLPMRTPLPQADPRAAAAGHANRVIEAWKAHRAAATASSLHPQHQ